jgi:beta-galactosidase/beta-glucuronidase
MVRVMNAKKWFGVIPVMIVSAALGAAAVRSAWGGAARLASAPAASGQRSTYDFNAGWKLRVGDTPGAQAPDFDDSAWQSVTLPRAFNEDDAFRKDIRDLTTGVAWYRKRFRLPAGSAGKKVFLEFEGIRHGGEFFLNGRPVGIHENGVMAFGLDITALVKPDEENVFAARIDNAWNYKEKATGSGYQWSDRNFYANYGGINKNVRLHVADRLYQTLPLFSNLGTTGVYVYAKDFDVPGRAATITAESQVRNEHGEPRAFRYNVVLEGPDGKAVNEFGGAEERVGPGETKTVSASARVSGLRFWSWGYGHLYTVRTVLTAADGRPIDAVRTRTGFRHTRFGDGMVGLNGRTIHLKGYAQRTTNEWPGVGIDVPAWVSDFSNRLMVEGNANLVRWMHVTPSRQDVESCDRVGLLQALPAGDSERDPDGRRWEMRVELMRDAIIYNRNSPSVVFYEAGNKGVSEEHMREMLAVRDRYDPHGGRAMGSREMLGSKTAEWGGEMLYINKSADKPLWATEYSRDEAARKFWDEFSPPFHKDGEGPLHNGQNAAIYNRNQDSHAVENVARWFDYWRERPGTGRRVNAGAVNIIFSDSNTHHRGAENYRRSGEVDAVRIPKDGYFAHQVMWDGWVDVEKPRLHLVGHWNYAPNTRKDIHAVSGAEKVELFVNGKSLGFGERRNQFLFTFRNVAWQPGELKAVGYNGRGRQVCEDARKTAGPPAALRLTPRTSPGGLRADGADLALIDVEVVDAAGNRCPTALNRIDFTLAGPGEWRGGIAQGPENHVLSRSLPVEGGVNRVLVRSTPTAGKIAVTASAKGLEPATVEITSRPVTVTGGLAALETPPPAFLGRGPTPPGESFRMNRKPLHIVSVKAGANSDKAALTIDDNEATGWSNDDNRANGWVQYDLAQPGTVSELTLKMGRWRDRSYPIRITVDGKEVFRGNTPQSLGYVSIPVKPTWGKSVGIELIGSTVSRDSFGSIVELENQANAATTGGQSTARGNLNIVEVEIYESVR